MSFSRIVLSNNYEKCKQELILEFGKDNLEFFEFDNLLIDDARNIISKAYISQENAKFIVIYAKSFGTEAQNALLKILEEPPRNIYFIIISSSKNLLLPTIISRLIIENKFFKKEQKELELDIKRLDLKSAMEFLDKKLALEKKMEFDKFELKECIYSITKECLRLGIKFSQDELEYINKLVVLAELNSKTSSVLTPLLLMILEKR